MNELTFKPADSVALYASRLIIATNENDPGCFDIHGAEYGTMQGYQLDGKVLASILDCLGIEHTYSVKEVYRNGIKERLRGYLKDDIFNLIQQNFTIYLDDCDSSYVKQLSIAENGHGGLQIKMSIHYSDEEETYEREISYFGPYSIHWRNDESAS